MENTPPPARLYKYRAFNARTIELLVDDEVYFANPADFNDPLDTNPSLDPDLEVHELSEVLKQLMTQRLSAEMKAAAVRLKYRGPKTHEHIERHTQREVERLLLEVAYMAKDPMYENEAPDAGEKRLLSRGIELELLRQYDKGVLSLSARFDCPLMWSHYADQHRGVAIGYSVPEKTRALYQVKYGGSRRVRASDVRAMLSGNVLARTRVDEDVLLRKAHDWAYEEEWRLVGQQGPTDSPLELEEVVFGIRCLPAVQHAVVKALQGRGREVRFYEMRENPGEFGLARGELDLQEPDGRPRRYRSVLEEFEDLSKSTGDGSN